VLPLLGAPADGFSRRRSAAAKGTVPAS